MAEVKCLQNAPTARIDDNHIVRKVIGNNQLVSIPPGDNSYSSGIRYGCSSCRFTQTESNIFARGNFLWRYLDESFGCDFAFTEAIHHNAVAGRLRPGSGRVGDRAHGCVEVLPVGTECEPEKE